LWQVAGAALTGTTNCELGSSKTVRTRANKVGDEADGNRGHEKCKTAAPCRPCALQPGCVDPIWRNLMITDMMMIRT
jgi:hypothetical protein